MSLRCAFLVRHANTNFAASNSRKESPHAGQESATSDNNEELTSDDKSTGSDINSSGSSNHDEDLESDSLLEEYARDILNPLPVEELLLESQIVTIKNNLLVFDPEQRYPGGEIQRLVDQCDWAGLFTAINNDHGLSIDLFKQKQVTGGPFRDHIKGNIWKDMERIRDKHFTKSNDGSKYTIRKYASRLSSKKILASHSVNEASHANSMSTPGEDWDGRGSWRAIKNLFGTFASRLASDPRSAASRPKWSRLLTQPRRMRKIRCFVQKTSLSIR